MTRSLGAGTHSLEVTMQRTTFWLACFAGLVASAGCGVTVIGPRVTLVSTTTPGTAYVVVHPVVSRSRGSLDGSSDYILFCDGRGTGAMVCGIPPEVGRVSTGPTISNAPATVPELVGGIDTFEATPAPALITPITPIAPGEPAPAPTGRAGGHR